MFFVQCETEFRVGDFGTRAQRISRLATITRPKYTTIMKLRARAVIISRFSSIVRLLPRKRYHIVELYRQILAILTPRARRMVRNERDL